MLFEATMENIQADMNNHVIVARCLDVLKKLIDRVEAISKQDLKMSHFHKT